MGQPIVVTEKPSSYPGVVRFETNRALTGMGHERYLRDTEVWGERPPDELARRLFTKDAVAGVQINSNVVTVDLAKGYTSEGLREVIENLYRFYPDAPEGGAPAAVADGEATEPADDAAAEAPAEPAAQSDEPTTDAEALAGAAPEALAEPADATDEVTEDAPAPEVTEPEPTAANPAAEAVSDPVPEPEPAAEPEAAAEPEGAAEPDAAADPETEAAAEPEPVADADEASS